MECMAMWHRLCTKGHLSREIGCGGRSRLAAPNRTYNIIYYNIIYYNLILYYIIMCSISM